MPARDVQVGAGVVGRLGVTLGVADAVDLGAHHRAVGDVEVPQRGRGVVAGQPGVLLQEEPSEVGAAEEFEIHRQERGIVDDVDVAQPVVEFQAVQQRRAVVEAEDVIGQQVGVAVDDLVLGDAPGEQHRAPGNEVGCQPGGLGDGIGLEARDDAVGIPFEFGEVLRPARGDGIHPRLGVHLATPRGRGVEAGQHQGDGAQFRLDLVAAADHGRQPALVGVAAHDEDGLTRPAPGRGEVTDAQVAVGGQSAVQLQLVGAGPLPALEGAEVEEVGDHRLLDLVGPVADEEHHPGVRLGGQRTLLHTSDPCRAARPTQRYYGH